MYLSKEQFLTTDEIVDVVKKYVDDKIFNYAILIDGEWGCGKTFFVKKTLREKIQEYEAVKMDSDIKPRNVIYLSLYGVQSINDIANELYLNIISKDKEKLKTIVLTINKVLSDLSKTKGVYFDSVKSILSNCIKMGNYIFIIDDLERCNCNINEVLGYINTFVEHQNAKVIFVANEKEIGKNNTSQNIEVKYLIAKSNDIKFRDSIETSNNSTSSESKDTKKITIPELNNRVYELFEQNSSYSRIKEKLIGTTIRYHPNPMEITTQLLITHIKDDEELKKIIFDLQENNIDLALFKGHFNLRTYQFFLAKISELNKIIRKNKYIQHNDLLKLITEYCFYICVIYKMGQYKSNWSKDSLYSLIPISGHIPDKNSILGFKFIDEFVIHSKLNENEIYYTIDFYIKNLEEEAIRKAELNKLKTDPLYKCEAWWLASESEILINTQEIIGNLKENVYPLSLYPKIILRFLNLVEMAGFNKYFIDETKTLMINNINGISEQVELVDFSDYAVQINNEEITNKYFEIVDPLTKSLMKRSNFTRETQINQLINDATLWGENLYQYVVENRNLSMEKRSFINVIDVNKLINNIKISDNTNLCKFKFSVQKIYNFTNIKEYYFNDKDNLKMIIDGIKPFISEDNLDLIKRMNLNSLLEFLEHTYNQLIAA